MPVFSASQLEILGTRIFAAVGAPQDVAEHVARSLVLSNLMGHDSHGVLRITSYLEYMEQGGIVPGARPTVSRETATTAVVDGNWAFGQVTAHRATALAIEKARVHQVAAVGIVRCGHIGRLGEYTEMAARAGMLAFMTGATYNSAAVAPYGSAARVLGTNPLCFALPGEDEPVVADMATSVVAEGKLRSARAKNQPVPPGAILDREGNPTTDANDYYDGGVMLPVGGHKGYALSVIAELVGGYLSGGEALIGDAVSFGHFVLAVDVGAFRPLEEYREAAGARLRRIKGAAVAPGFTEVLAPGEPERRFLAQRSRDGIPLPEDTVEKLAEVAARLDVPMPAPLP